VGGGSTGPRPAVTGAGRGALALGGMEGRWEGGDWHWGEVSGTGRGAPASPLQKEQAPLGPWGQP